MHFFKISLPFLALVGGSIADPVCPLGMGQLSGRATLPQPKIDDINDPNFCLNHQGFFADSKNCRRGIQCAAGVPTFFNCAAGEIFNPVTEACEATTFTSCKQLKLYCAESKFNVLNNSTADSFEKDNEELGIIMNASPVQQAARDEDDIILPPVAPGQKIKPPRGEMFVGVASLTPTATTCTGKGKSAIVGSCTTFNVCIRNQQFTGTCAGNLQFDVAKMKCLPPGIAHCVATLADCTDPYGIEQITGFCDRYMVCCNKAGTIYYCKTWVLI